MFSPTIYVFLFDPEVILQGGNLFITRMSRKRIMKNLTLYGHIPPSTKAHHFDHHEVINIFSNLLIPLLNWSISLVFKLLVG